MAVYADRQLPYYVVPTNDTDHEKCPSGVECHTLSYYLSKSYMYSSTGAEFIFLNGKHFLDSTFNLFKYVNLSLVGLGKWRQGSHWSVHESTVVIKCTNSTIIGFRLVDIYYLQMAGVTITGCGKALYIADVSMINFWHISIQNSTDKGIEYTSFTASTSQISVMQSCFYRNCLNHSLEDKRSRCSHASLTLFGNYSLIYVESTTFTFGISSYAGMYVASGNKVYKNELYITDSLFYGNYGTASGGLYVIAVSLSVKLVRTRFINNTLHNYDKKINGDHYNFEHGSGGTGLILDSYGQNHGHGLIFDCLFQSNKGGGAFFNINNDVENFDFSIYQTSFKNNIGKYGAGIALLMSGVSVSFYNVSVTGSRFPENLPADQYSAVMFITTVFYKTTTIFLTNLTLQNNFVTGLLTIGCSIAFLDVPSTMQNNSSPLNGGGMWADDKSLIISKVPIYFSNNKAKRYGGAIYSQSTINSQTIYKDYFTYNEGQCPIADIDGRYHDNKAGISGNDVYGGKIYNCMSKYSYGTKYEYDVGFLFIERLACNLTWQVYQNITKPLSSQVSSDPLGACFCYHNNTTDCYNRSADVTIYPGQWVMLSLITVGMCGGITPGRLAVLSEHVNVTLGESQLTGISCKQKSYQLIKQNFMTGYFKIVTGLYTLKDAPLTINVKFLKCPVGLQMKLGRCKCNDILEKFEGVQCNISRVRFPISRYGSNWLYYDYQINCTIAHKNCPFDYCHTSIVYINFDEPDLQCALNRTGMLCGKCQPGFSLMLGSNRCGICNNKYLSLILVFIAAGIALVVFLLITNLTVSIGSINGLLFYANVVKLNGTVLLSDIPVLSQFIAWLNFDFGIETCFLYNLDGYLKTWLQFIFPVYVWLLIAAVIIGCYRFGRLSRLCGNNTVPVLATLVLMSYTKLLLTIQNALMMSELNCENTTESVTTFKVWNVDGSIPYFTGKHIPLVLVSTIFLFIGLLLTILIFSSQWLQRYSSKCCRSSRDPIVKLKPLIDAYIGPYKDKYRFWTGFLLIVRIFFTSIFSYVSGNVPEINNYIIFIVSSILMSIVAKGVYRNAAVNFLEFCYLLNLSLLSTLSALSVHMQWNITQPIVIASIALSMLMFFCTLVVHVYVKIIKKYPDSFCNKWWNRPKIQLEPTYGKLHDEDNGDTNDNSNELGSPARVVQRRESLIFDFEM